MKVPDPHSIQLAYEGVGLKLPLKARAVHMWEGTGVLDPHADTWAIYRHSHGLHEILVLHIGSAWSMTESLLHEMMHAVQMEEAGSYGRFMGEYVSQKRRLGLSAGLALTDPAEYRRIYNHEVPFEREAIAFAAAVVDSLRDGGFPPFFHEPELFDPTGVLQSVQIKPGGHT